MHPENEWGWNELLLAKILQAIEVLAWMQTEDAKKREPQKYPELLLPESLKKLLPNKKTSTEAHDLGDIKKILSRPRHNVNMKQNE